MACVGVKKTVELSGLKYKIEASLIGLDYKAGLSPLNP